MTEQIISESIPEPAGERNPPELITLIHVIPLLFIKDLRNLQIELIDRLRQEDLILELIEVYVALPATEVLLVALQEVHQTELPVEAEGDVNR